MFHWYAFHDKGTLLGSSDFAAAAPPAGKTELIQNPSSVKVVFGKVWPRSVYV